QAPYLLFYPDRDGNDIPDRDPDVLLTGFGMEDAHSVANSLTWVPDGWLYGCQGSTVTANIRGIEFQQGVWRYHPITHKFELFCEGGATPRDVLESWMEITLGKSTSRQLKIPAMLQNDENFRIVRQVITILDRLNIPYALGGSMASSILGKPRFTLDA